MNAIAPVPDLKIVKDDRNTELLRIINEGDYNLSHLEQQYGISVYYLKKDYGAKSGRRGRPKKSHARLVVSRKAPVALVTPPPLAGKPPPLPRTRPPVIRRTIGVGCLIVALVFAGGGAFMNYQFGSSFGWVLGVITIAIDGGALLFFAAAGYLWEDRRWFWLPPPLCLLAFLIWLVCVVLSTCAALGFASGNIGDGLQFRDTVIQHRRALVGELSRAETERGRITEDRDPQAIEQQIQIEQGKVPSDNWRTSNNCTNVTKSGPFCLTLNQERMRKVTAEQRVALDAKIKALSTEIAALPPVSAKDPPAEQIAAMAFGLVTAEQVRSYLVRCLAIIPGFASILLAIARTLLR